ncbi:glyoxylate/hydroxypyruvate reductase A [Cribrihabitans marinus]|uniref:Glyoxylate/hydroxypyruvate reductase A n=1 Tax=Cribrihabitans marinus TaxID=1227549 RepID=A0A1H7BJ34_9RHOB|nr:glyoxylate/hydroxypyruvate reductase A [Cribrihabitans marinus]GGH34436.1 glyoxylate/hydroxypyruvate reductase A [Cribrihabitans marinus]SEJ77236.1 glyoxylate/hydroxypyruvate reductase A [Cribrihabitans marinus]
MALMIETGVAGWMDDAEIAASLRTRLPDADIRTPESPGNPGEVTMLAVVALRRDRPTGFPNLQLVQKLGAGVETIVHDPALPAHVRVARLRPETPAREIAEWFLAYVLRAQRNMDAHDTAQRRRSWAPIAPREADKTVVGVLGLGHIGGHTARLFRDLGFQVKGWSRSPKSLEGIDCHHGARTLPDLLGTCDHVCAILPSTPATRGLFGPDLLAAMKPGATLLNAGRGDLIDEAALLAALDRGTPGRAVLDVVSREPLPEGSPLWSHPAVTITPHVSGWHLGDALDDVAENYRRLTAGTALLHEVDRARGY